MKSFNINDDIYVKLTEHGKEELKRQFEELKITFPSLGEYNPPKEDSEGFSKWQCWDLMSRLGDKLGMGFEIPFELTIRLDENNLQDIP